MAATGAPRPVVMVVSDGRGETCSQLLRAALVQYEGRGVEIIVRPEVLEPRLVAEAVEEAAARQATIFYTLVGEETRKAMRRLSGEHFVPAVDVLGPAFTALHDVFHTGPSATPGLFYAAERQRIDRQAAIDFTLKHDDGLRPHELGQADVVLVGISRVSKSTTCFYLAYRGIKAANVPLVGGRPLRELLSVPPEKVIGLRMNVTRLMAVREARARHLGTVGTADYVAKREIAEEMLAAQHLMQERGWRSFDVSYMAVEEIAREVMRLRGLTRGQGD
jgi:regulator of PEP synthase PpsR (kinase-PPPase family)